jgi:hypothetical protein
VDKTRGPFSSKQVAHIITTLFYRSKTHSKACLYQSNACVTRTPPLSTRINNSNCPFYLRKKKRLIVGTYRFDGVFIFARCFLLLCCQHHPHPFPSQSHNILLTLILVREEKKDEAEDEEKAGFFSSSQCACVLVSKNRLEAHLSLMHVLLFTGGGMKGSGPPFGSIGPLFLRYQSTAFISEQHTDISRGAWDHTSPPKTFPLNFATNAPSINTTASTNRRPETSSICWANLNMLHLKTNTESSLRNVLF